MNEDEAKSWILNVHGAAKFAALEEFARALIDENSRQNLISSGSIDTLWSRHIVDSAQLLTMLDPTDGCWIDVGTGGGFPGIVIAILRDQLIMLIEPRRQRAAFLTDAAQRLPHVTVRAAKVAQVSGRAAVVSARAVSSLEDLFDGCRGIADRDTVYIFPRGRSAADEVTRVQRRWRGVFHVKQSITDSRSAIVVARQVVPR